MSKIPVGAVRPSQMMWTYGPGALVDLPNVSVVTMGLDRWEENQCRPIDEARLLDQVRRTLGGQVNRLRMPPVFNDEDTDPFSAEAKIGVPVSTFPRFLRCVRCGLLGECDLGLFECKEDLYFPERTHYVHKECEHGARSDAVPARFLLACCAGHLDDFPWHFFVHGGQSDCRGTLRFYESAASMQTENIWVKCNGCGVSKTLAHAFGPKAEENLPGCRGRHPHLGVYSSACNEEARTVLLGATNSWFPINLSVLAIPHMGDSLSQLITDGWEDFVEIEDEAELRGMLKGFKKRGVLPGIDRYEANEVWDGIQSRRNSSGTEEIISDNDVKTPEWEVLTHAQPPQSHDFRCESISAPPRYDAAIVQVALLKRLREVSALVGFTRVDAPEETGNAEDRSQMADLSKERPTWVPATEVFGEGIFLQFGEQALQKWEQTAAVKEREALLLAGHAGWRNARHLDPREAFPGIRFVMLHTLSHLLIRELALECGYNAASIRERVYANSEAESPMAGILLYTAAADSDGTLGGLIELGKPDNLGRLMDQALLRGTICSSDPLCSEHDPGKDRSCHSAACHACAFAAETSCEKMNRYLDRALVVKTFDCDEAAFFGELLHV